MGIYSRVLDQDQTITIYYDELRIGDSNSSYNEVAPNIPPPPSFPEGWGRKCILAIQADKIDANQINFPVLLTEDTLPSEMFDADGDYPALNGGGDIRFSSDNAGSTQLSCEVVTFITDNNPANGVAEIWVKVPSISSSSNTTIYVWYNKSGESQPAIDATYGAESVWDSNFVMVQHLNEDPSGSSPQMIDSTSNDKDGISNGTMLTEDLVAAQIGKGLDLDGNDDYINIPQIVLDSNFSVSFWAKPNIGTIYQIITDDSDETYSKGGISIYSSRWRLRETSADGSSTVDTSSFSTSLWQFVTFTQSGTTASAYYNGSLENSASLSPIDQIDQLFLGSDVGEIGYNGKIDDIKVSNSVRSASWIKAEYNNQNNPATFVIEGIPGDEWITDHFMIMGM